jgi:hypothetical protein
MTDTHPTSQLLTHKGSHRVTRQDLHTLGAPLAMGPRHRPIAHYEIVDQLHDAIEDRGWSVAKEALAVARKGHMLFGVMDLRGPADTDDLGTCFGFRSSTNQSFALRGVAGARVLVCDNMVLSGSEFVMRHKLTLHLNLPLLISQALNKFITQSKALFTDLDNLRTRRLSTGAAKTRIFDLFNKGAMPLHLFDDVSNFYFNPTDATPDCTPRTAWGLHNACTRSMKVLSPTAQFTNTLNVGREFQLAEQAEEALSGV